MDFYLIIPLVEVVFCLALLFLLIVRGRQHVAKVPFAIFLSFMGLWGIFIFLMRYSPDLVQAAFWENFVFGAILSAALSFYIFTVSLTGAKLAKKIILPLSCAYVVALGLIPSGLIIQGMQSFWYGKAPVVGMLFPIYVMCVYVPILLGMIVLIKSSRHSKSNDEKIRNQYIIIGIIALFVGGTTDYLPAIGIQMYPLGIIGNIVFCFLATVAMLRHGLMEIRVVLRKGVVYSLSSILIFGIFGSIILVMTTFLQKSISPLSMAITVTAVFLIAALFQPLLTKLQHVVDRWFFRERYDHLQALKRFAQDKEGDLDLNQLSLTLVNTIAGGMQSEGVDLLLQASHTQDFITYVHGGQKKTRPVVLSSGSPLTITMKYQDGIMDLNDVDILPVLSGLSENDYRMLQENNIELMMPLKKDGRLTGILVLSRHIHREPYSNEDKQLLQSVSEDIATRIDNASRFSKIIKQHTELQKTMDGVIFAVSAVVESRDPYTAGHQRRVAELARAIAGEMGLSEWHMKGIHIIGLLHDVGKIAVPAEILSKPGKISQYEFNIIKGHSRIGYEILEKIDFPWPVARAILQHHERLNGSGYPDGLSGHEISLEARILGVADVVEAMSSHRPYRPALGLEVALQEIRQQSGILYDREVVEACLRLLKNGQFAFEKLMSTADSSSEAIFAKI
ncbi:MAG: HD domain-containing protein [Dehalococcoidales bacterium]|nr:HD domain-containing protein [Dehalococcoidales bacterium]